jgi:hypothetical protein
MKNGSSGLSTNLPSSNNDGYMVIDLPGGTTMKVRSLTPSEQFELDRIMNTIGNPGLREEEFNRFCLENKIYVIED